MEKILLKANIGIKYVCVCVCGFQEGLARIRVKNLYYTIKRCSHKSCKKSVVFLFLQREYF